MRKGKALMSNIDAPSLPSDETKFIAHIRFGFDGIEVYYMSFKEKRSIHAETRSEMGVQEVHTTLEAINSLDWAEPIKPNLVFRRKVEDKVNQYQWPLDKTVWADGVITLDTKTDKDAIALKQAKVEVLEKNVIALRKHLATLIGPPPASNLIPSKLAAVTSQLRHPKALWNC
ncbi:hypothetical protein HAX54_018733 [Datura stramonium]|uniref:Uncharacterized protein n=1 Tax=Datura stramonium TaxID=4076 RepID=A0ABS8UNN6_DATST|nr:hypothetical protein [Datura stramonium]